MRDVIRELSHSQNIVQTFEILARHTEREFNPFFKDVLWATTKVVAAILFGCGAVLVTSISSFSDNPKAVFLNVWLEATIDYAFNFGLWIAIWAGTFLLAVCFLSPAILMFRSFGRSCTLAIFVVITCVGFLKTMLTSDFHDVYEKWRPNCDVPYFARETDPQCKQLKPSINSDGQTALSDEKNKGRKLKKAPEKPNVK